MYFVGYPIDLTTQKVMPVDMLIVLCKVTIFPASRHYISFNHMDDRRLGTEY